MFLSLSVQLSVAGRRRTLSVCGVLQHAACLPACLSACPQPDMCDMAIGDWRGNGFPGLTASKSSQLLNHVGASRQWAHVPSLRRVRG